MKKALTLFAVLLCTLVVLNVTALADFGDFSGSLHSDGTLYLAVHSGRGFFDVGKGKEPPDALRRRFTRELKWYTDMIDVFRPAAE